MDKQILQVINYMQDGEGATRLGRLNRGSMPVTPVL